MTQYYIAFDTETTGLLSDCNLLTAFFIILDQNLNKIDTLDLRIKHTCYKLYTGALKVNNINLIEHEKTALYINEAKEKLISFLEKVKSINISTNQYIKFIPIGHNIQFDIMFIKNLLDNKYDKYFNHLTIDTLVLSQFYKMSGIIEPSQKLSLVALCNLYNIKPETGSHHTSEYDILCTIELLKLFKTFNKNKSIEYINLKRKRID